MQNVQMFADVPAPKRDSDLAKTLAVTIIFALPLAVASYPTVAGAVLLVVATAVTR